MRLSQFALSALSLVSFTTLVSAKPFAIPDALAEPQNCPIHCNTICCTTSQYCSSWSRSQCGEGAAPGGNVVQYFTTTFVTTDTSVKTITSVWSQVISAGGSSASSGYISTTWAPPTATSGASATRSNTFLVPVATASASAGFNSGGIIGQDSSAQGLSSGQIGGIVGGILGAFFLIALILFCCCMRRGFNGFFGWMNSWGGGGGRTTVVQGSQGHGGGGMATAAAGAGLLGYLFGRKRENRVESQSSVHSGGPRRTGMAALGAGLAGLFASRRSGRTSEKYSTTDYSSGYHTSDGITDSTSYTSTSTTDSSSSSSSSNSSSSDGGHHHHGRGYR